MATVQHTPTVRRRQRIAKNELAEKPGVLGPWHPDKLLGEGTLARVYSARHNTSRPATVPCYAIKVLRPEWHERLDVLEILRREALIGSRVRHENVIPVLDARLHAPPYYTVMPRLVGCTLQVILNDRQTLPPIDALWIARQVAEGMAAIDSTCGTTHGDVKPSNVFLSPQGRVTILDMGFGQACSQKLSDSLTDAARPALCSLAYAAPETVSTSLTSDFRSDIYSLGVMLYQMLSGRLPHEASDPATLVEVLQTQRPECIRGLRPELPEPVAALVHGMLSKEPLRRPGSYAELIDAFVRLEISCYAAPQAAGLSAEA